MKKLFILVAAWLMLTGPALAQTAPQAPPTKNASGTITTGGSFQQIISAAPGTRAGCLVVNPPTATEALYVFFGPVASATTATAVPLTAGATVNCGEGPYTVTDAVAVEAATTGHAFTAMYQ